MIHMQNKDVKSIIEELDKISFIVKELDFFSLTEESFFSKFNINVQDAFYQDKASLIYCDYYFFKIIFSTTLNRFTLKKIENLEELKNNSFFAIKAFSDHDRLKMTDWTPKQRADYLDSFVKQENEDFISIITQFSNNSFNDFTHSGISEKHIHSLFELLYQRKNIINF